MNPIGGGNFGPVYTVSNPAPPAEPIAKAIPHATSDPAARERPLPPVEEGPDNRAAADRRSSPGRAESEPDLRTIEGDPRQQDEGDAGTDSGQQRRQQQREQEHAAELAELKRRDREVRAHEAAHAAVGGLLAGAARFQYTRGPDGARYAVAGEVPIRLQNVSGDPLASLRNAEQVRRAALAPASPSMQDQMVAAAAARKITGARAELLKLVAAQSLRGNGYADKPVEPGQRIDQRV